MGASHFNNAQCEVCVDALHDYQVLGSLLGLGRDQRNIVSVFEFVIAMMIITIGTRGIVPIFARRDGRTQAIIPLGVIMLLMMTMMAMETYEWSLSLALRSWVALGAHGSPVCACGVVWAPFARGLVCFFMKTRPGAWKSRKCGLWTRVPVNGT